MTWNSNHNKGRWEELDNFYDFSLEEFNKKNMSKINWHNVRMYTMLVLTFVIAGLQGLKGSSLGDFTTVISVLLTIEHFMAGNTTPTS